MAARWVTVLAVSGAVFVSANAQTGAYAQDVQTANADPDATVTIGTPDLRGSIDTDPRTSLPEQTLTPEEEAKLRAALSIDVTQIENDRRRAASFGAAAPGSRVKWTEDRNKDGAATVKVTRALPTEWDAKIGADVGLAPPAPTTLPPDRILGGPNTDAGSGTAWASVAVPNVAAFDARVTPTQDQSALGATFKQSVPLGDDYAVTLQNRYGVVDTFGATALAGPTQPGRFYTTDRELKLNVLSSKTAVAAGTSSNTADNVTRGRVSAEQQIYGPLRVEAGVSDIGAPVTNKTLKAGFKLGW